MSQTREVPLAFSTLVDLDSGRIDKLLAMHLARIAQDCMNRPGDKTKRKVTLEFEVSPVEDPETRECEHCKVAIECKSKVPTYRSKVFQMRVTKGGLLFNKDFPDSLHQAPLNGLEEE